MHCCLLGGLEVTAGGEPLELGGPKQRAVLAVLLLHAGRPLSADVLIDRVWGEEPPARVHISLQAYISNLRRALEPERRRGSAPSVLVSRRAGYAVEIDPDAVDVHRLDHLAMAITTAADEGRHADVVSISDTARAMWRGPLLPEFAGLAWVDERQVQLDRTYLAIRRTHAETLLTVGHPDGVLAIIEPLLIDHPYDEHLYALAATADYQLGNQRAALSEDPRRPSAVDRRDRHRPRSRVAPPGARRARPGGQLAACPAQQAAATGDVTDDRGRAARDRHTRGGDAVPGAQRSPVLRPRHGARTPGHAVAAGLHRRGSGRRHWRRPWRGQDPPRGGGDRADHAGGDGLGPLPRVCCAGPLLPAVPGDAPARGRRHSQRRLPVEPGNRR
ncbi:MAG: BTAD domain-containing putative transcriptional regulator [Ilumatobacteraceae bacterium]